MNIVQIGTAVHDRRKALRLNQNEVAELAGVARSLIVALEGANGARGVTLSKLLAVCNVLGLELSVADRHSSDSRTDA